MANEILAAGDAMTAGLAAATLEGVGPSAGRSMTTCLNCGAGLTGRYCSNCGQLSHVERSLWHLLEQALHGLFHFDGKVWRTLPPLIYAPGRITRDYIEGRRARHVSPLAMFLMSIFASFFIVSVSLEHPGEALRSVQVEKLEKSEQDLEQQEKQAREAGNAGEIAGLEAARRGIETARRQVNRSDTGNPDDKTASDDEFNIETDNAWLDSLIKSK